MAMTREAAYRKWQALCRLTVARGATTHEAETAARFASILAKQWGFQREAQPTPKPDFSTRYARAEKKAASHWHWEYRTCGKSNCHCSSGVTKHGPYKYSKKREGKHVRSIYMGL